MALDLNHGIYVRRGGTNYFYASYTHAISPAIAFRVGGVTRYCPLVSGGGYLKVRKNGTTYGISGATAIVEVDCDFSGSKFNKKWTSCSIYISNNGVTNGIAVTSNITVSAMASFASLATKHYSIPANTPSGGSSFSTSVTNINKIEVTVTVFGKTYTGSASVLATATSVTCRVTVS